MADGYTRYRTRRALIDAVLDQVGRTGDPALPWAQVPGLAGEFAEPRDLLLALHHRWCNPFNARLDALLENPPADRGAAVRQLWDELAAEMPVLRKILDAHADDPDLTAAGRRVLGCAEVEVGRQPSGAAPGWERLTGSRRRGRGPIARTAAQGVR